MKTWADARLCDVLGFGLGVSLFTSPWSFGFVGGAASWNAIGSGLAIIII
jgi:hypothetical protein